MAAAIDLVTQSSKVAPPGSGGSVLGSLGCLRVSGHRGRH